MELTEHLKWQSDMLTLRVVFTVKLWGSYLTKLKERFELPSSVSLCPHCFVTQKAESISNESCRIRKSPHWRSMRSALQLTARDESSDGQVCSWWGCTSPCSVRIFPFLNLFSRLILILLSNLVNMLKCLVRLRARMSGLMALQSSAIRKMRAAHSNDEAVRA